MEISLEAAIIVHGQDGLLMKFKEYKSGFYYFNTRAINTTPYLTSPSQDYLFLNTIATNKGAYTWREIEGANQA
jgi:hypothetical protein